MKKVCLFVVLFFTITSFSQPRTNEVKLEFEKVGEFLNTAIGWNFNVVSGKWEETKKDELGYNKCGKGFYDDEVNFKNLFFTIIKFEDKNYYILNLNCNVYRYDNPSIKVGLRSWGVFRSFMFNEEEYNKLKNYSEAKILFNEFKTNITSSQIGRKELSDLRDTVLFKLKHNNYDRDNLTIQIKKEGEEFVRFIIPTDKNQYNHNSWGFDKKYFEVSKKEYDKMFE